MVDEIEDRCRICLDQEATPDNPLLSPCACKGSQLFIHKQCLKQWLDNSRSARCQICRTPYRIDVPLISIPVALRMLVTSFWDRMSRNGSIFCQDPDDANYTSRTADLTAPRFRLVKAFSWLVILHYMFVAGVTMIMARCLGVLYPITGAAFATLFAAAKMLVLLPINTYRCLRWMFWASVGVGALIDCVARVIQFLETWLFSSSLEWVGDTWDSPAWELLHMLGISVFSCFPLAFQVFLSHAILTFQNRWP